VEYVRFSSFRIPLSDVEESMWLHGALPFILRGWSTSILTTGVSSSRLLSSAVLHSLPLALAFVSRLPGLATYGSSWVSVQYLVKRRGEHTRLGQSLVCCFLLHHTLDVWGRRSLGLSVGLSSPFFFDFSVIVALCLIPVLGILVGFLKDSFAYRPFLVLSNG